MPRSNWKPSYTSRRRPRPVRDVIAGLDPATHHLESTLFFQMDARVKPAHDESEITKPDITDFIGSGKT
jgi:hypothetical protein